MTAPLAASLLAPIPLTPVPVARRWGGRQLGAYLGQPLPAGRIGELIQLGAESRVASGAFAGESLAALVERFGSALVGALPSLGLDSALNLPVVRLLDASHWQPPHAHLRSARPEAGAELYHILAAHKGSGAGLGLRDAALGSERPPAELIRWRAVKAGETILCPPGLIHALGGGTLAYGVRWPVARTVSFGIEADGAGAGELAVLAGVDLQAAALDGRATAPAPTLPGGRGLARWLGLRLERAGLLGAHAEMYDGAAPAIFTPIAGELALIGASGAAHLRRGESALVPAAAGRVEVRPAGEVPACTVFKLIVAGPPPA